MAKLSDKQMEALSILKEEKSLPINSIKLNKNTMNSLYFKGLVRCPMYANGKFWEMTDDGIEISKVEQTNI
jgi:hypothetical protein